jgi:hypothetical protein
MTPAEHARNSAISFECKKDSLRQMQNGDWRVSLTIQAIDMSERITKAPMGTRFVAVLVEIDDSEQPITPAEKESAPARPDQIAPKPDRAKPGKRDWRDLPYSQQAGIRINEPTFAAYLREEHPDEWHETGDADACLKLICRVDSKSELGTKPRAETLWFQIDSAYQAWLAKERVGA